MPDIFVPADTTGITNYYTQVWNSNALYRYTLEFTDRHREAMDRVTNLEELDKLLSSTDLIADFVEYAEGRGIETNHKELELSKKTILAQIRAYIGRNTLTDGSGFYYNIYPIDEAVQRAVEELKSQKNK
jgi:carboxyl-terminal processing protease